MKNFSSALSIVIACIMGFAPLTAAQWVKTNGPFGGIIRALGASGGTLFTSTPRGAFCSTDNGTRWTAIDSSLPDDFIESFSATEKVLFAGTVSGIFLSTNNGRNWTAVNNGITDLRVVTLWTRGDLAIASTYDGNVWRSTNSGSHWKAVCSGLPAGIVHDFASIGDTIFGATDEGVYRLLKNDTTWTPFYSTVYLHSVCIIEKEGAIFDGTFGVGVFRSDDTGGWTECNSGLGRRMVTSLLLNNSILYAGTDGGGIFMSMNNGAEWTPVNSGLTCGYISALTMNNGYLFAGTNGGGIFLSTNNGSNWIPMNEGIAKTSITTIAVSGSHIFSGTAGGGVFMSTNGGASWMLACGDLSRGNIGSLCVKGSYVFAGGWNYSHDTDCCVFRSTNNGLNWEVSNSGLESKSVRAFGVIGNRIFAGTNAGIFLSTNDGASWSSMPNSPSAITCMTVLDSALFAATLYNDIYRSTNNGVNWRYIFSAGQKVGSLGVAAHALFAGVGDYNFYSSTDGGDHWEGLRRNKPMAFVAYRDDAVFSWFGAGINPSTGLHLSVDNGNTWKRMDSDSLDWNVTSLAICDSFMYAGITDGGVCRRPLPRIESVLHPQPETGPVRHPFFRVRRTSALSGSLRIEFFIPHQDLVTVRIYNLAGRLVSSLVNAPLASGAHQFFLDARDITTGLYIVKMQAGGFCNTTSIPID